MKSVGIKLAVFSIQAVLLLSFSVAFAFAASNDTSATQSAASNDTSATQSAVSNDTSSGLSVSLMNPLDSSISSIPAFFLAILDILLVFAIPFVVFFIIYAGFMYVTAQGNPGKISQAHNALLYAIVGGVIIFGARAILAIVTNTANNIVN